MKIQHMSGLCSPTEVQPSAGLQAAAVGCYLAQLSEAVSLLSPYRGPLHQLLCLPSCAVFRTSAFPRSSLLTSKVIVRSPTASVCAQYLGILYSRLSPNLPFVSPLTSVLCVSSERAPSQSSPVPQPRAPLKGTDGPLLCRWAPPGSLRVHSLPLSPSRRPSALLSLLLFAFCFQAVELS